MKIRIGAGETEATAELDDTRTARTIWEALAITGRAKLWGDGIYFAIPVELGLEAGQELANAGDLGYWPDGNAFCIFFGPMPVSQGDEIRPASPISVSGRVIGDPAVFRNIPAGTQITVRCKQ